MIEHFNNNGYFPRLFGRFISDDEARTIKVATIQSEDMEEIYKASRKYNPEYADRLYVEWLNGGHDPDNLKRAFQQIIDVGQANPTQPHIPTTPGSWSPPTTPGMHEICQQAGPFFMSGLRVPGGLLLGTYRPAKLFFYDGQFHEEFSGPQESVYMLHMTPTGPIFTTERPAGVWKKIAGQWKNVFQRPEIDSLAFDIWPYRGGLILFTADNISLTHQRVYVGDINGEHWRLLREHDGHFPQMCTDGQTYWLVGEKDRYPYIQREDGAKVIWMKDYKDQIINYASVKDGLFTLGLNNIDPLISDGTRRNGYVMYGQTDGMYHSGIDLKPPFIMQTDIHPVTKERFAVASIWNETGYPNPQMARSKDGRQWNEKDVVSIPMPSVQTFDWGDGGAYLFGGKYNEFGKVCFWKP